MSLRAVKPELITCLFLTSALLVLLIAARSSALAWRPLLVGIAAMLATLALENKVQAIFIVMSLPLLILPFGEASEPNGFWKSRHAYAALAGTGVVALVAVAAALPLVREGLPPVAGPLAGKQSVFGAFGVFQILLAIWLALGIAAFAWLWRVPALETTAAALSLIGGVALGLLALNLAHDSAVVGAVINPLDQLLLYAIQSWPQLNSCQSVWCGPLFTVLVVDVPRMIANHTFFLHTSPRPAIFLEWVVIAATVIAYRRGHVKVALQAATLLLVVWGIDILQATRGLKQDYFNFTDPLIIVAAVILLANLGFIRQSRLVYPVGVGLLVLHAAFSQAEPAKHAFMRSGAETKCSILNLPNLSRFPFCAG